MTRLRAVIAEDEPLARGLLRGMLAERGDVEIVADVGNGLAALEAIERLDPDLVLLDVEMPELDGFGVVDAIGVDRMPAVIFVTAFDQYAIRAFDVHAFDYLLKPFDRDRLDRAVDRVVRGVRGVGEHDDFRERLDALLAQVRPAAARSIRRIPVPTENGFRLVAVDDIDWIEADGKVVRLHVGHDVHTVRRTMSALLSRLDPTRFVRVHRSAIVNVQRIKEVQSWFRDGYVLILTSGTRVTTGRRYRTTVQRLLDLDDR